MTAKSSQQKVAWTAAERAQQQALRAQLQAEQPTLDDLIAGGEYVGPVPQGAVLQALQLAAALREARELAGLSLSEVARRSGIDKGALSRLETGRQTNPTLDTLWRYAGAVGRSFSISLTKANTAGPAKNGAYKPDRRKSPAKRSPRTQAKS